MPKSRQGNLANLWAVGGQQSMREGENRWHYKFCPECGWRLTGKFSRCPRCEADLRLSACPYCGGDVPKRLKRCPRCTAPLKGTLE
ncbi:MAG: double zinc ribbon domain-containing protein [Anaerolineales bacterium]